MQKENWKDFFPEQDEQDLEEYWEEDEFDDDYEFSEEDYFEGCYKSILLGKEYVSNVETVSLLRHYLNLWGVTDELRKYLTPLTDEQIQTAQKDFAGLTPICEVKANFEELKRKSEAWKTKSETLKTQLESARDRICGIGWQSIMFILKGNAFRSPEAVALAWALQTERANIESKQKEFRKLAKLWDKKMYLMYLKEECRKNGYTYGYKESEKEGRYIVYFELPNCEQISFFVDLTEDELKDFPRYEGEWDGVTLSTLPRLEEALKKTFTKDIADFVKMREEQEEITRQRENKEYERIFSEIDKLPF